MEKNKNGKKISIVLVISIVSIVMVIIYFQKNKVVYNINRGNILLLGSYEQDGIIENGKEPIEWKVVSISDTELVLISRYGLDYQPFDSNVGRDVSEWKTCTLRNWLNNDFYDKAFSEEEKTCILEKELSNIDNPINGMHGGDNTIDKVFIPNYLDIVGDNWVEDEYFPQELHSEWTCAITEYVKGLGIKSNDNTYAENNQTSYSWILRTPGTNSFSVMGVNTKGGLIYGGFISDANMIIRPMICVSTESSLLYEINDKLKNQFHIKNNDNSIEIVPTQVVRLLEKEDSALVLSSLNQGDFLGFGSYEQDGNYENGKETINWLILKNDGKMIMMLSRDILDFQKYNGTNDDITWKESSLRKWLNGYFYDTAFNEFEKKKIIEISLKNEKIPEYEGDVYESKDKVFLLSYEDIKNDEYGLVGSGKKNLYSKYSGYVLKNYMDTNDNNFGEDTIWWLRNRSRRKIVIDDQTFWNQGTAIYKDYYSSGINIELEGGVRPVICIYIDDR